MLGGEAHRMLRPVAPAWTVLIYTSASPDLREAVQESLTEISDHGAASDSVQVVAQMGTAGSMQRFQLHGVGEPQALGPATSGEMTEPGRLREFLEWGMSRFPAQRYAVVLGGHGAGFAGAVTDSQRRTMLSLPSIQQQLSGLPARPELLIFNTCLMAQAEVAEQLQGTASQLVASQSQLKGLGLPLAAWLPRLDARISASEAAHALAEESSRVPERAPQVSALSLEHWPEIRRSIDTLAGHLMADTRHRADLRSHFRALEDCWPRPQDRPVVDQHDLGSLVSRLAQDESLPEQLRQSAQRVGDLLDSLGTRLSLYGPDQPFAHLGPPDRRVGPIYADLDWSKNTRWDEFLYWLVGGGSGGERPGSEAGSNPSLS